MSHKPCKAPETISEKLKWLEDRYWKFGQDEVLADYFEDLFEIDDDGNMTAQPRVDPLTGETKGLMLLGGSEVGKTTLINRTVRASNVLMEHTKDKPGNTMLVTVPPTATLKKLAEIILAETGYTRIDPKTRGADAWELVLHRLGLIGIKLIIIDECHHMVQKGLGKDVPTAIQSLKHIMQSGAGVALLIAGVPALRDALLSEPSGETYRRFNECSLFRIVSGTRAAHDFTSNFLHSARILGVSVMKGDMIPDRILFAAAGQIGTSISIGKEILREAIKRQRDALALEHADRVYRKLKKIQGITPFEPNDWEAVKKDLEAIGWVA
jgi:hypothetical protein